MDEMISRRKELPTRARKVGTAEAQGRPRGRGYCFAGGAVECRSGARGTGCAVVDMGRCPIPRGNLANDGLNRGVTSGQALRVARNGHFTRYRVRPVGIVNHEGMPVVLGSLATLLVVVFFEGFPVNKEPMIDDCHASSV